jgi:uncharacterized protein (DUF305 family)
MTVRRVFFGMAIAVALLAAACGDSGGSATPPSSAAFNSPDIAFAHGMIPHHTQAVEMADLATTRASSAKVKDLAVRIKAAQGPEIASMTAWLKSWNKPVATSGSGMGGMDMSGSTGSGMGMMSAADMKSLTASAGAAFDKMFLTMMIEHHKGAIGMANTERATGKFAGAKTMADAIVTGQQAEIDEMNKLLTSAG